MRSPKVHRGLSLWDRLWRWAALGGTGALGLSAYGYGRGWAIPQWQCWIEELIGLPGPGCGLTRSWIALTQGHLLLALQYHLLGPIFALGLLGLVAQGSLELWLGRPMPLRYNGLAWLMGWRDRSLWCLGLLTLLYYFVRLYARYGEGGLVSQLDGVPLWEFVKVGALSL